MEKREVISLNLVHVYFPILKAALIKQEQPELIHISKHSLHHTDITKVTASKTTISPA